MRRLTRGGYGLVSPDGATIAVSRRSGIFTIRPDGSGGRSVAGGRPAAWLPDSRHLLAIQRKALVNIDLGDRSVDVIERGEVGSWSVSPDGQDVAYDVYRRRPPSGECWFDIHVARLDGSSNRALTQGGRSSDPVWGATSHRNGSRRLSGLELVRAVRTRWYDRRSVESASETRSFGPGNREEPGPFCFKG
jgi:hypothetical protein